MVAGKCLQLQYRCFQIKYFLVRPRTTAPKETVGYCQGKQSTRSIERWLDLRVHVPNKPDMNMMDAKSWWGHVPLDHVRSVIVDPRFTYNKYIEIVRHRLMNECHLLHGAADVERSKSYWMVCWNGWSWIKLDLSEQEQECDDDGVHFVSWSRTVKATSITWFNKQWQPAGVYAGYQWDDALLSIVALFTSRRLASIIDETSEHISVFWAASYICPIRFEEQLWAF